MPHIPLLFIHLFVIKSESQKVHYRKVTNIGNKEGKTLSWIRNGLQSGSNTERYITVFLSIFSIFVFYKRKYNRKLER